MRPMNWRPTMPTSSRTNNRVAFESVLQSSQGRALEFAKGAGLEMVDSSVHCRSVETQVKSSAAGGRSDADKICRQTMLSHEAADFSQRRLHRGGVSRAGGAEQEQAQGAD